MVGRVALVVAALGGCFAPEIATGVPCGASGACPSGQVCDVATDRCESTEPGACDSNEQLVDGVCTIPITVEVTPAPVSPAGCDTQDGNNSRSIGIDDGNRIYVAFRCGNSRDAFVVTSLDGGATASMPVSLGISSVDHLAVRGGARKVGYVGVAGTQGVAIAITQDGATWSVQTLDATRPDTDFGVAVGVERDRVYVAAKVNSEIRVWRNGSRGVGAFERTDVMIDAVFGDMLVDSRSGDVWVVGDSPDLHVRRSSDGGVTFDPVIDPMASYTFSAWSLGGGSIFVTGSSQDTFTRLSTADPAIVISIPAMLPPVTSQGRSISVAPDESVYIVNGDPTDTVTVLRFEPGSSSGTSRSAGTGSGATVIAGPGRAAPFVMTSTATTKVQLGVYLF